MAIKTITVRREGPPARFEAKANAALSPGHLIEILSTGKVQKHGTEGGACEKAFALENENYGKGIETAYATDEQVVYEIFKPGDVVLAIIADGENVSIGSKLESKGAGTLKVVAADTSAGTVKPSSIVGVALEAVNMSGSAGADPSPYCKVRIVG